MNSIWSFGPDFTCRFHCSTILYMKRAVNSQFSPAHTSPKFPEPSFRSSRMELLSTSMSLNGIGSGSLGQALVSLQHKPSDDTGKMGNTEIFQENFCMQVQSSILEGQSYDDNSQVDPIFFNGFFDKNICLTYLIQLIINVRNCDNSKQTNTTIADQIIWPNMFELSDAGCCQKRISQTADAKTGKTFCLGWIYRPEIVIF